MKTLPRRTKIVATLGPASRTKEQIRNLILAGMDVARLNFSHASYEEHAEAIANVRAISEELNTPITILQDLQGPKVRVGPLPEGSLELKPGATVIIVPQEDYQGEPNTIPIDYPHVASEAKAEMQILLADGLFELKILEIDGNALRCEVVEGGILESRKGVNFPDLDLRFPSLTEKDIRDLIFGIEHKVDWVSLSFVRNAEDVRNLKDLLAKHGANTPVVAKIEKPQAVERLDEILDEVAGIMVARGDLGVEMKPEKVPMLQKRIIEACNRRGIPVITATQMLESMVKDPRPTRAEASDVANAIIDGTDAVMLSAETAAGAFPVRAVQMMARIALDVENGIDFKSYPANEKSVSTAVSAGVNGIAKVIEPRCIAVLTTTGHTAHIVAAERPKALVAAITTDPKVYHALNLFWGIKPLLAHKTPNSFDELVDLAESTLCEHNLCEKGDNIFVIGGVPVAKPRGSNFIKIHTIGS
ncbi:pyruvate kinase [Luteolibacter sp. AS25]|uniref:pyruvate kinase n=1 Tax=Luteolibacter sp. AS25 TaxID=3135776 RepID=UPI00398B63B0